VRRETSQEIEDPRWRSQSAGRRCTPGAQTSVRSCAISRARLAPSTPNRHLALAGRARARVRLATFAHAMSNRKGDRREENEERRTELARGQFFQTKSRSSAGSSDRRDR
jgi:hypothetical protein